LRANEASKWPYSAWEARVNGALASKLDAHIKIVFAIVNNYFIFSEYTGVGT